MLIKTAVRFFLSLLMLFQLTVLAFGQSDTATISGRFLDYNSHVLEEKIFVHTDKPVYFAGEIIWFKVYNVDGTFHKPIDISKVAYVEILDKENKPVLQAKIALIKGNGNGSFYLPVSLNSGSYKFRAYTSWMKNFSPDYFFEKNIHIINTLKTNIRNTVATGQHYDIQFFPEGGNLVSDIPSKVGFRAVNSKGQGVDFKGAVVDENNVEVVRFQPLKFGIGNFRFTPASIHSYRAVIKLSDKDSIIKDLPFIYAHGYIMNLSDKDNGTLDIHILTNPDLTASFGSTVFLLIHTGQIMKVAVPITLIKGKADYSFSKDQLGEGISHITLFNSMHQAVCERLYFKYPNQKLVVDVKCDSKQYSRRENVGIEIVSKDASGLAVSAGLSVAVYKQDSIQSIDPIEINSYLWLSSDIQGAIESPDYYFKQQGPEVDEAIDNLMLTQGWRRFRWDDLLKDKLPVNPYKPEYEGHIIRGKITDTHTNQPAGNIVAYLSAPGNLFQFYNTSSDSNGQVNFYTHHFYKSGEIIVQTGCESEPSYKVTIENPFSTVYAGKPVSDFQLNARLQKQFSEHSIGMQAQNIYSGKSLSRFNDPFTDSLAFYEKPDLKYFLDDYTRFGTMEEVIREYVTGVYLHKKKNNFYIKLVNNQLHEPFGEEPLVLLDGIPVCDFDKIMNYDPSLLKKIEIVNRKYYAGEEVFGGIISFSTYKGNYADLKLVPNALIMEYEGLQAKREFFSPVYEAGNQKKNRQPDFRNLLYWSPNISTDALGKARLNFYTPDLSGNYIIMVQGITANGIAGSQISTLLVK